MPLTELIDSTGGSFPSVLKFAPKFFPVLSSLSFRVQKTVWVLILQSEKVNARNLQTRKDGVCKSIAGKKTSKHESLIGDVVQSKVSPLVIFSNS